MRHKPDLIAIAEEVVEATLATLPPEVASEVEQVSVFVEELPNEDDREHGVGADWLGIFEGASHLHLDLPDPPRIRIWVENLWTFCSGREADFREEVRITLLHEIGHFLGLDEEAVAERGLE
ncbi:MAG TPA: metallopeptidase family protein [Chthoniobacterales bacterium]|nr:metallopeptidase family protein [Chthoniobacterales bacterium]